MAYTAIPVNKQNYVAKNYVIGAEKEISVGDILVSTEEIDDLSNKFWIDTYKPSTNFSLFFPNGEIRFNKDESYYSIYQGNGVNLVQSSIIPKDRGAKWMTYLRVDGNGNIKGDSLFYSKEVPYPDMEFMRYVYELEDHSNFNFERIEGKPKFTYIGKTIKAQSEGHVNRLRVDLIYTGKSKNTIKLLHREYYTDKIRDAFTHELSYDLDESNVIRYKNIRVQVVDSTNENIKYKVISD
ncbi:MAG: hypothetical protein ACXVZU_03395 [Methanobacteriaceae archaeon]